MGETSDSSLNAAYPLVSCVVIFYNAERYLAEALESVLCQSYPNWELVLVDDGSLDTSRAVASEFQARAPDKIRVLSHPGGVNRGKSASRNLGIRDARGEFVALLDADDAWFPCKLDEQVRLLRSAPNAAFAYGPVQYWYSWTGRPRDSLRDCASALAWAAGSIVDPPRLLTRMIWSEIADLDTTCPYPSSVIFRRSLFDLVGGFEEDFTQLYDDAVFFARVFAVAKVLVYGHVLARYRLHSDARLSPSYENAIAAGDWNLSTNPAQQKYLARVHKDVSALGLKDRTLQKALREAELPYLHPRSSAMLRPYRRMRSLVGRFARQTFRAAAPTSSSFIRAGEVRWGDLGRRSIGDNAAAGGRGGPIAVTYLEHYLKLHAYRVAGDVGEFGDDVLARRYGGDGVHSVTILDPSLVDLAGDPHETAGTFDCLLAVDMIRFAVDAKRAVGNLFAMLRHGGVLLASVPGMMPALSDERDRWRWTEQGARHLFVDVFGPDAVSVTAYGSLRAATATLHHMGVKDLGSSDLITTDPKFSVQIVVLAERKSQ
jgi:glycosyltransferase involved in cell wall biosynthesis